MIDDLVDALTDASRLPAHAVHSNRYDVGYEFTSPAHDPVIYTVRTERLARIVYALEQGALDRDVLRDALLAVATDDGAATADRTAAVRLIGLLDTRFDLRSETQRIIRPPTSPATAALAALLTADEPAVVTAALGALGDIGDPAALPALQDLWNRTSGHHVMLIKALYVIGGPVAVDGIAVIAAHHRSVVAPPEDRQRRPGEDGAAYGRRRRETFAFDSILELALIHLGPEDTVELRRRLG